MIQKSLVVKKNQGFKINTTSEAMNQNDLDNSTLSKKQEESVDLSVCST